ncbi:SDR family NAD(P)-dependent oxidoreductase [Sinomonas sp. ASV486]|uniref:SDR family NAD(P)-dependent oxidoreductase n=1 Tax=Sinomonas sp. ASV486 TaxID=3051170 RepID=UPI0027DCBCAD|nr:SDR family NAD(P)-dependent oxidoreductase [Sinomonas sp. ASV486]MDQ4492200.1 SDR family NAD(P)-dependent oxidoreductase [Sinomonas sp. ASV486]
MTRRPAAPLGPPRTALVVGGTGGIGAAVIRELAPSCERIIFTYGSQADAARDLERELDGAGASVRTIRADLTDSAAWEATLGSLVESEPIDLLVNAAGVSDDALCIDVDTERFARQYQVNVTAPWIAMRVLARDMAYHRRGRIINVASIAATVNSPGRSVYASTKAAIVSLTKSFAVEVGRFGIRVNAVAPGFVETPMIEDFDETTRKAFTDQVPLGRFATAEEVARVVGFLAGENAEYLHGTVVTVDGGTSA